MSDLREKLVSEFLEDEEAAYAYYNDFLNLYIATQIKVLREERGYKTQTAFANAKGIKQEQISHLENIDTNAWSVNTLRRVARALGVVVKVSFESFSDSIETIVNFRRETLQRPERVKDLSRFVTETSQEGAATGNLALLDSYNNALMANRYEQPASGGNIIPESALVQSQRTEPSYETGISESSQSGMAVPPDRPESAGQSFGERRAA